MPQAKPRFKRDIRIKPDAPKVDPSTRLRPCDHPGCEGEGAFKVTRSRDRLGEYIWLCLDHARAHNESWDFFAGMDENAIEAFRNDALTGHRPTWPLGKRAARMQNPFGGGFSVDDGHGHFENDAETAPQPRRPERTLTRLQMQALDQLQLAHTATLLEIKARYKELVKRFHPDANGGDRGAEERLKQVIKAYGVLRATRLTS
ncbi:MAG: J domain-containing protein [Proteobacteria bacterium]|nr:J domain-containing protein [Pseudomonadota bacterium]